MEGDAEAKADFNALKNQWDAIEKDFATYGSKAVRVCIYFIFMCVCAWGVVGLCWWGALSPLR